MPTSFENHYLIVSSCNASYSSCTRLWNNVVFHHEVGNISFNNGKFLNAQTVHDHCFFNFYKAVFNFHLKAKRKALLASMSICSCMTQHML